MGVTELRICPHADVLGSSTEVGWLSVGTVEGSGLRAESCQVLMQTRQCQAGRVADTGFEGSGQPRPTVQILVKYEAELVLCWYDPSGNIL